MELSGDGAASDPRDFVYAIVGVAADSSTIFAHGLLPDYNLSLFQVFERLWDYLVYSKVFVSPSSGYSVYVGGTTNLGMLLCWAVEHGHSHLTKTLIELECFPDSPFKWYRVT